MSLKPIRGRNERIFRCKNSEISTVLEQMFKLIMKFNIEKAQKLRLKDFELSIAIILDFS